MDTIKPLFTATATATGGRNGRTEASDGSVKADLSVPKEMGGPGRPGTTTPEHLFAAGYAACFGGALDFVAKKQKKDATKARITCSVSIGPRDGGRHRRQDAGGGQEPAPGRARRPRQGGARADLPLLPRHARQRARRLHCGGRVGAGSVRSAPCRRRRRARRR